VDAVTLLRSEIEAKLWDVSRRLNAPDKTTEDMRLLITERKRLLLSIERLNHPEAN
jgi:hypothetical protein